jgi:hypothetical protein
LSNEKKKIEEYLETLKSSMCPTCGQATNKELTEQLIKKGKDDFAIVINKVVETNKKNIEN